MNAGKAGTKPIVFELILGGDDTTSSRVVVGELLDIWVPTCRGFMSPDKSFPVLLALRILRSLGNCGDPLRITGVRIHVRFR